MNDKFIIKGGNPLNGVIKVRGAKNAAFPIIASTLLTNKDCVISNVPLIEDVFRMLKIMESIGAEISWLEKRKVKINCKDVNPSRLPFDVISRFRGSILILGPLLARFKKVRIVPPGGCIIGARSLDTHLDAFRQMGVEIAYKKKVFQFSLKEEEKKKEVVLKEFSVTATENILLFSSLLKKETILKIADEDYQVQELVKVLRKMGVRVSSLGCHAFKIKGEQKLKGFSHRLISDPIEGGTFIITALITKGEVTIKNAGLPFLTLFLKKLKDFGAAFEILKNDSIKVYYSPRIKMDKIQSLPYPGIHTDLQPVLGVLATQSRGQTLIHDPLFEGRLKYLEKLNKMGADIFFSDPHRAIVRGPTRLYGMEVPSLDLRAGATLIIAGLVAKGETILSDAYQIDRGYEKIEERLQKLGADIKRRE